MLVRGIQRILRTKKREIQMDWKLPINNLLLFARRVFAFFHGAKESVFPTQEHSDLLDDEFKED